MPYTEGGPEDEKKSPEVGKRTKEELKNIPPKDSDQCTTEKTQNDVSFERLQNLGFSEEDSTLIQDILSGKIHQIPDDNDSENTIMTLNSQLNGINNRITFIQNEQQKGKKSNPNIIATKKKEILNQLDNIRNSPYFTLAQKEEKKEVPTKVESINDNSTEQYPTKNSLFDSQDQKDFTDITKQLTLNSWKQVCKSLQMMYLSVDRNEYEEIINNSESSDTAKIKGIQTFLKMCCDNRMFGNLNIEDLNRRFFDPIYQQKNLDKIRDTDSNFAKLNFLYCVENLPWGTNKLRDRPPFLKEMINAIPKEQLNNPKSQGDFVTLISGSTSDKQMLQFFEGIIGTDKMNYFINKYIPKQQS